MARTPDELLLCRQTAGEMLLEQVGRTVHLQAGDMTLLDLRLPYTGRLHAGTGALVVKIPRARLQSRVGRTGNMVARALRFADGDNRLVSEFLALLPAHTESVGLTASLVADQSLDLIALALVKATDASGALSSSSRFLVLARLRASIEKHLADPNLTPASAAAAAGISVRYANALLADEQMSLARTILRQRLERCRRALADRLQAHRSIAEIAYGWGFSDMTHFGRKFREVFGQLPSEYRRHQATINASGDAPAICGSSE